MLGFPANRLTGNTAAGLREYWPWKASASLPIAARFQAPHRVRMLKNGAALMAQLLPLLRPFTQGDCGHSGAEPGRIDKLWFMSRRTASPAQVSIIQGSTGSGKTTQVPQYILDFEAQCGCQDTSASSHQQCPRQDGCGPKTIVVTQPRRLAAMTAAVLHGETATSRCSCRHPLASLRWRDGSRLSEGNHWVPLLVMQFALIPPRAEL